MTKPAPQIEKIFDSLEAAGYSRSLLWTLLPDWVTAEALSDPTTSLEIAAILAKQLGLRPSPLFTANPRVEPLRQHQS